jgi:hypothetical protein
VFAHTENVKLQLRPKAGATVIAWLFLGLKFFPKNKTRINIGNKAKTAAWLNRAAVLASTRVI